MSTELPTYILLEEAARRYRINREVLTNFVESGKIKAVQIDGRVAVADMDIAVVAAQMQASDDGDELVSLNEAARRLGVHSSYLSHWVDYGWLKVESYGPRRAKLVSFKKAEALAKLHKSRGYYRGSRLIPRGRTV